MLPFRLYFLFLSLLTTASGCGQQAKIFIPQTDSLSLSLGDTSFTVVRYRYDTAAQPFLVHLHHNEQTADSAAQSLLEKSGGIYLTLINNRKRLLTFSVKDTCYTIDPNRMFTPNGRKESLEMFGIYTPSADSAVTLFAEAYLALLPPDGPVIAMHNNTPNQYSIASYQQGGIYASEVANVHRNPQMDIDDFVFTTDKVVFSLMKRFGINTVLQNNNTAKDDGSLGFYFGRQGRSYTNVEAEHEHFTEQLKMTSVLIKF